MSTATLASYLLVANALWDLVTGVGILIFIRTGYMKHLADAHSNLWICEEDRDNKTISIVIACIIIQMAAVRSSAAMDPVNRWPDATFTYWLEGVMVGGAAIFGKLHAFPSAMVLILCIGCAGVIVSAGMDQ